MGIPPTSVSEWSVCAARRISGRFSTGREARRYKAGAWRRTASIAVVAGLVWLAAGSAGAAELERLARPGIWTGVSSIIGYRDQIWFVNSEKFRNHNSADLYTFDPRTGRTRYRRALFSQDSGDPLVAFGLLYWPHEDSRFSPGRGEFTVTNGREWAVRSLRDGLAFHLHTMVRQGDRLYAAASAWRAGIQVSRDRGASWRVIYDHETPRGYVSRITSLAILDDTLYGGLTAAYDEGTKLLRRDGGTMVPQPRWPRGTAARNLVTFGGWLYAVHDRGDEASVWRTDGVRVEPVRGLDGLQVQDLAAGSDRLWAVVADGGQGRLMSSRDGLEWSTAHRFTGESPIDVAVYAGRVYVGTMSPGGGALWGEAGGGAGGAAAPGEPPPALPGGSSLSGAELAAALEVLDRALADPSTFESPRGLRAVLEPFVLRPGRAGGEALSERLGRPFPDVRVSLIGGQVTPRAADVARWYLLRAIGLSRQGRVPPGLLSLPWREQPNPAEKYFHLAPAAIWAVSQIGQNDDRTLAALVDRLAGAGDPRWLRSDVVSALTLVTGESFAYDLEGWRRWWRERSR